MSIADDIIELAKNGYEATLYNVINNPGMWTMSQPPVLRHPLADFGFSAAGLQAMYGPLSPDHLATALALEKIRGGNADLPREYVPVGLFPQLQAAFRGTPDYDQPGAPMKLDVPNISANLPGPSAPGNGGQIGGMGLALLAIGATFLLGRKRRR